MSRATPLALIQGEGIPTSPDSVQQRATLNEVTVREVIERAAQKSEAQRKVRERAKKQGLALYAVPPYKGLDRLVRNYLIANPIDFTRFRVRVHARDRVTIENAPHS